MHNSLSVKVAEATVQRKSQTLCAIPVLLAAQQPVISLSPSGQMRRMMHMRREEPLLFTKKYCKMENCF